MSSCHLFADAKPTGKPNWSIWSKLVVQDGGRMKPLDTHAWELVTSIVGRGSFTPAEFGCISLADIPDFVKFAEVFKTSKDLAPIRDRLPAEVRAALEKTNFDLTELDAKLTDSAKQVEKVRKQVNEDFGAIPRVQKLRDKIAADHPDLAQILDEHLALEQQRDDVLQARAALLPPMNELIQAKDFFSLTKFADTTSTEPKTPMERASRHRSALEPAFAGTIKPMESGTSEFGTAAIEPRRYSAVELYVTWILGWQGWDRELTIDDLEQGRSSEATYWRFHKPDVWDATPMIDARYQQAAGYVMPELLKAASPRNFLANDRLTAKADQIQDQLRAKTLTDRDLNAVEKKLLAAARSYHEYAHHRIGGSCRLAGNSSGAKDDWLPLTFLMTAPADGLEKLGFDNDQVNKARSEFRAARKAFLAQEYDEFNQHSQKFADVCQQMSKKSPVYLTASVLDTELHYNRLQPFLWTTILALTGAVFLGLSMNAGKSLLATLGNLAFWSAIGMQIYATYLRVVIAGRPPVTNMFETIVWASLITAVLAVVLGSIYKTRSAPFAAAVVFGLANLLAHNMPIDMGASITPLMPVLRTNYWLVVHVMTIVASYGACMLAWAIGNLGLFQILMGKDDSQSIKQMAQFAYRAMQVGLLLLSTGTILGGWWAAESWGRFWGWDPKETWALIACLCYLIILHSRFAGLLKNFGTLVGAVLAFSGVVMAWYGVNFVLGAGLHAYAFGDGGQPYVLSVVGANLVFVLLTCIVHKNRQGRPLPPPAVKNPEVLTVDQPVQA